MLEKPRSISFWAFRFLYVSFRGRLATSPCRPGARSLTATTVPNGAGGRGVGQQAHWPRRFARQAKGPSTHEPVLTQLVVSLGPGELAAREHLGRLRTDTFVVPRLRSASQVFPDLR
jgi:hypothetical protein